MKRQPKNSMCRTSGLKATLTILAATCVLGAVLANSTRAEMYRPDVSIPGGIQVRPTNWFTISTSNAVLNYEGLESPYAIQLTTDGGLTWSNVGLANITYPNTSGSTVITAPGLYRLMMLGGTNWVGKYNPGALAVSNVFVGATKCNGCHGEKVTEWMGTAHAGAYANATNFAAACRSVGVGQPGGFVSLAATPQLANVQCENCHGSATVRHLPLGRSTPDLRRIRNHPPCGGQRRHQIRRRWRFLHHEHLRYAEQYLVWLLRRHEHHALENQSSHRHHHQLVWPHHGRPEQREQATI
jgi:hypothetical protein